MMGYIATVRPRRKIVGVAITFALGLCGTLGASISVAQACQPREAQSADLPDCRAYEQVTPANNDGAVLSLDKYINARPGFVVSESGESVVYSTLAGALPGAESSGLETQVISTRAEQGWKTSFPAPRVESEGVVQATDLEYSGDLSKGVLLTHNALPPALLAEGSLAAPIVPANLAYWQNIFLSEPGHKFTVVDKQPSANLEEYDPGYVGVSKDFTHVVYEGSAPATPEARAEGPNVYEWAETGTGGRGEVRLVGKAPNGETMPTGVRVPTLDSYERVPGAISDNGSHIFFYELSSGRALYVRIDGKSTVALSKSQRAIADPAGPQPVKFQGATPDGSKAYFTSASELTNDAYTGTSDNAANLYEYNEATGALTDLTVDEEPADAGLGAQVQGVMRISDDGAYVYFVADGVLAQGTSLGRPTGGQPNLYLSKEEDGKRNVTFIRTLSPENDEEWMESEGGAQNGLESQLTADGTHLLFLSKASLTGYDNRDVNTGQPDNEIFEYSASDGSLTCISCNPGSSRPMGGASLVGGMNMIPSTNMTKDGSMVVFQTSDALVPQDTNSAPDVYEYEGGQLYLLSDGVSPPSPLSFLGYPGGTELVGMGKNGANIMLLTRGSLVSSPGNGQVNIFDARVGAELASSKPSCGGEACQGAPTTAPSLASPGSASYAGVGNATPSRPAVTTKKPTKKKKKKKKTKRRGKAKRKLTGATRKRLSAGAHAEVLRGARGI